VAVFGQSSINAVKKTRNSWPLVKVLYWLVNAHKKTQIVINTMFFVMAMIPTDARNKNA